MVTRARLLVFFSNLSAIRHWKAYRTDEGTVAALERIEGWSPRVGVAAMVDAVARAVARSRRTPLDESEPANEPGCARKLSR